ncbi:MAG: hypothetical protein RL026_1875 [Pseudomonadota bacterium]|jgi:uncharacterized circularly permuted ATP-grasp superfamily protein/uncharacterized alpha-E superfamily protein
MSAAVPHLPMPGLAAYRVEASRHDELLGPEGGVRPAWQGLLPRLLAGGAEGARRRVDLARRLVAENGVTYNVYADTQGRDRPWVLDPCPWVLGAEEWRRIERGVVQRARLLDALLADLYGRQAVLREGLLPPELVFGHPNHLWACQGLKPPGGRWLHLYAADLARAPDGRWWVIGDRTQSPSGPGYALENRQIVARVFPEAAADLRVQPVGGFFNALRELLVGTGEGGLAVVLTPGPFNETYFEHAYLARQLGLPLVEGNDLTVRGARVHLKTVTGLQPVRAILRRLDDDYCDPVELRADSALGVPGLLEAVRAGTVLVANALGSGVLETPGLQGFLPGIARRLLDEPLQLPGLATWWCGEGPALEQALARLDHLVVKPTYPNQRFEPVFGADLDRLGRQALAARLRARPAAYVAQERLRFSQAPSWSPEPTPRLVANSVALRVFAVATPQGYQVLPGGMARMAGGSLRDIVSTQRGGGSKDVWVLGGGNPAAAEDDTEGGERDAQRGILPRDELPSSLVENLFWLGRYAERCEDKTRLLRASFATRADAAVWQLAWAACRTAGVLEGTREPGMSLFDADLPLGLVADLGRLAAAASRSRQRLSQEHWRSLSVLQRQFEEAGQQGAEPSVTLDRLLLGLAAFAGFTLDDMTQDAGWRMLMLGRHLERLQFMAGILAGRCENGRRLLRGELDWLLDVGGSTITHRTRYVAQPRLGTVVELLVLDAGNPRALAFHWEASRRALQHLPMALEADAGEFLAAPVAAILALAPARLDERSDTGAAARVELQQALQALQQAVWQACDRLALRHFSHVDADVHTVVT